MFFQKEDLDLVLVPAGLLFMFSYHLFLLYRYLNHPHTTALGFENHNKRAWVERILLNYDKDTITVAVNVITSNITAATVLSTISITLSSLIGAWLGGSSNNVFESSLIYGDTRAPTISLKYISLLVCFLLAFSCFVQSIRHFVHANYLISIPESDTPLQFVQTAVIRGGEFWSLGLRALYFALLMLLWFFGPIPMCVSSIAMVIILHHLDINRTPLHHFSSPWSPEERKNGSVTDRISAVAQ